MYYNLLSFESGKFRDALIFRLITIDSGDLEERERYHETNGLKNFYSF